jgi:hypothetical protein
MSQEEMRQTILTLSRKLTIARRSDRKRKTNEKRQRRGLIEKQQRIDELEYKQMVHIMPGRKAPEEALRHKLTLKGMYDLGYRQSLTYGGINSLLKILDTPVHRHSVSRAELTLSANICGQMLSWTEEAYCRLNDFVGTCVTLKA